jgi:hypothetical protein
MSNLDEVDQLRRFRGSVDDEQFDLVVPGVDIRQCNQRSQEFLLSIDHKPLEDFVLQGMAAMADFGAIWRSILVNFEGEQEKLRLSNLLKDMTNLHKLYRASGQVLVESGIHDTCSQKLIRTDGFIKRGKATMGQYDGMCCFRNAAPHLVFLLASRIDSKLLPKTTNYPRQARSGDHVDRIIIPLTNALPLHTLRFELYFLNAHVPWTGSGTMQMHVVVLDRAAADYMDSRDFCDRWLVPLSKLNNPLFWYSEKEKQWYHPELFGLNRVVLNLAIANHVTLTNRCKWCVVSRW